MHNILKILKNRTQTLAAVTRRRTVALAEGSNGGLFIEMIIAVFVFTLVGTAILKGISTTQISGARVESQGIAENVARNQAEYVMSLAYIPPGGGDYEIDPGLLPLPSGYTLTATPELLEVTGVQTDPNSIEKVVVTVSYEGAPVLNLETIKTSG